MALSGTATNRTSIDLPVDVSQEILQKTQEDSAIMRLARQIALPGRGTSINVITSDPEASWVGETAAKPVSDPGLATKVMRAYKLAVIVPFSNEFRRDVASLYDALVERLPRALAQKFDATVFGNGNKPGNDFDNFASVTAQSLASDVYGGLVAADTDISLHGGIVNGYALSPQARGILLAATDKNDRPLFVNSVADGAIPMILGAPTYLSKGAFVSGSPSVIGVAGDWTQAMYGTVEGVKIDYSADATLDLGSGNVINLFQQNMFAVRAEIEVGFRADTSVFNALTATNVPSI
jgi:HK97 family phage major capsid protein